jgi:hypothetical protein
MDFSDLNFVKTCEQAVVNFWGDIGDASSTFGILNSTTTEQCYSTAVSYFSILSFALLYIAGACVIIWLIAKRKKK